jgi:outer membrane biosynthesis protein TonB
MEPKEPEITISEDSVAVDDIFQDALSAVAYSGSDEEDEEIPEDIFSLDEIAEYVQGEDEGITTVPVADPTENVSGKKSKRKKENREDKPGLFQRIFGNVVTDTTAQEEEQERQLAAEAQEKKLAAKQEKKQQAEKDKEEKAQLLQEQKEQKKQKKAEEAAKKAEQKAEKKRLKAERQAEADKEVVGKINPIGATIVIIFFATIGIVTIAGSRLLERRSALNNAENYFANEDYIKAYDAISNVNLKEDDEQLYERIRICTQLKKELNSYQNYTSMDMKTEALDSLIKGIRFYDENAQQAQELQIQVAFDKLKNEIVSELSQTYGIDEAKARELLQISDLSEYTQKIQEIAGV